MRAIRAEGNRENKHYIRTTNDTNMKLHKLAVACSVRAAELSYICLDFMLHERRFSKEFLSYLKISDHKNSKNKIGKTRVACHYLRLCDKLENQLLEVCKKFGIAPATFHNHVLEFCVNSSSFVHFLQYELGMNKNDAYRVTLFLEHDRVKYI